MKLFGGDTVALKQHFGKKIQELEGEKRTVQVLKHFFKKILTALLEEKFCLLKFVNLFCHCSKRGIAYWLKLKIFLLVLMVKHKKYKTFMLRN